MTTQGFSHIRLTVTDYAASRSFYEDVFSWPVVLEASPDADAATLAQLPFSGGGVLYDVGNGQMLGLRPAGSASFHEDHTGLDHLSFAVASREDLERTAAALDQRGVAHEPIKQAGPIWILQFRDPDNIALELSAPGQ